jgi:hypothetical protein
VCRCGWGCVLAGEGRGPEVSFRSFPLVCGSGRYLTESQSVHSSGCSRKALFLNTDNVSCPESRIGDLVQNIGEAHLVRQVRVSPLLFPPFFSASPLPALPLVDFFLSLSSDISCLTASSTLLLTDHRDPPPLRSSRARDRDHHALPPADQASPARLQRPQV